jgi:hypothetical protein
VNRTILQNCLFFGFGNTGADAAIAILLPTLKHFSCNGAVDGSTVCFCCESVLQKNFDSFLIDQREFRREFGIYRNRVVPSAHAIKTWVRNFEATGSTLKTNGGSVKSVERWLQTARVTPTRDEQNGVDSFNGLSQYINVRGCTYSFYTPTFLL